MVHRVAIPGLAAVITGVSACGENPPSAPREPVPVVLYVIDTLRADRLGLYGHGPAASPRIDALAKESALFERASAVAPWTLPSMASLLTSTYPCEHGVLRFGKRLGPQQRTLAERLKPLGYRTGAWYNNYWVGGVGGLDRGADVSIQHKDGENARDGDLAGFLAGIAGQPWLAYLHTIEPHHPFATPYEWVKGVGHVSVDDKELVRALFYRYRELKNLDFAAGKPRGTTDTTPEQTEIRRALGDHRRQIMTLYDAGVRHADHNVGLVVDELKRRGLWDKVLFVLTSDHGEEFGEHGDWFHDQSVYEELMHVPLLVHFPGGEFAGKRIGERVSLLDIVPTVLDFVGHPEACDGCRGRSLLPLLRGESVTAPQAVAGVRINEDTWYEPLQKLRGDLNVAVRKDGWKAIWNADPGTLELYDLERDPGEQADLSGQQPLLARELRDSAIEWYEQCGRDAPGATEITDVDERTREQLRGLGYFN